MNKKMKGFIISATVALSAVVVGATALGLSGGVGPSVATDVLPSGMNASDIGKGGLDVSTLRLVADTAEYQVWTARDVANNYCVISLATPEGNSAASCVTGAQFQERGISMSTLVGTAEHDATSAVMLETYLLPEGASAKMASKMISGSKDFGQVVVKRGMGQLDQSSTLTVPAGSRTVELRVTDGTAE